MTDAEQKQILDKILSLNDILWEGRIVKTKLDRWKANFKTDEERVAALYLLSKFMFFNERCIRMLLEALYRDLYRYPIIRQIREDNGHTLDEKLIETEFKKVLDATLFESVGTSSESSAYLQYPFRQTCHLHEYHFRPYSWRRHPITGQNERLPRAIRYCVFIDDFCGTGNQVTDNKEVKEKIDYLRSNNPTITIYYFTLISTLKGKEHVRNTPGLFDDVDSVIDLDETFECFSDQSRIFEKGCLIDKNITEQFCRDYGKELMKHYLSNVVRMPGSVQMIEQVAENHSLGYNNCQLLLGMHHNVPDNTLPIIWYDEEHTLWNPIFKRAKKI